LIPFAVEPALTSIRILTALDIMEDPRFTSDNAEEPMLDEYE
jgi:hypothetical protein